MRWYKFTYYLLINFVHTENTTTSCMIYLISPSKVFVFLINCTCSKSSVRKNCEICSHLSEKKYQERIHWRSSTMFLWTVLTPYSCTSLANFKQVIVSRERSFHKQNLSKQHLFFHVILILLKFVHLKLPKTSHSIVFCLE